MHVCQLAIGHGRVARPPAGSEEFDVVAVAGITDADWFVGIWVACEELPEADAEVAAVVEFQDACAGHGVYFRT
jgi:hypothetical protein